MRVTMVANPANFQQAARKAMTIGGCAFEGVERGIKLPVSNSSRAAGT